MVKLKGTCNHQDHAGVGIALPDGLMEWRVKTLLGMGSNAYRTSHNPVAPELLDACDRLGMLVLDETRHLGDTTLPKTPKGTTADGLAELRTQILRDRNHPSVIAWSLYNEEPLQGTPEGAAIFTKMRAVANALDGTRISTGATNFGYEEGIIDVTRLFGFNYNVGQYDPIHKRKPDLPLFGSETASALSTRGIYANDPVRGYVSAYDVNAPSWGSTAEAAWKAIGERPFMAGAFVWTGFDYKGEPTPYEWPCINSHFGILDIAGFPKDSYWYYRSWWGDAPVVHLLPHWNWPDKTGTSIPVWAYSNADRVELFLNGKSLGAKDVPKLGHVEWSVPYAPGVLEARGTKGGKPFASERVETTGAPAALRLVADDRKILADGEDVAVVRVEVVDAKGRVVPTASNDVRFAVAGAATIGGVGNGDPSDHDPDKADHRKGVQRPVHGARPIERREGSDQPPRDLARAQGRLPLPGRGGGAWSPGKAIERPMSPIEAVLLTGGASRRMGRDKATLPVDGEAQAARIVRLLAEAGIATTVLGKAAVPGAAFLPDDETVRSPIDALRRFRPESDLVLVLSCDLPRFDARLADRLNQAIGAADAVAPFVDGFRQPMVALYRRGAFDRIPDDASCPMGWLNVLDPTLVDEAALGDLADATRGANTPEEMARLVDAVS